MPSVYFIQAVVGGPIKIGYSADINHRLTTLQSGSPFELKILCSFTGTKHDEASLHQRFKSENLGGEWFGPSKDLAEYIAALGGETFAVRAWSPDDAGVERRRPLPPLREGAKRRSVLLQEYARARLTNECKGKRGVAAAICKATGFSEAHVSNVLSRNRGPGDDFAAALGTYWGMSTEEMLAAALTWKRSVESPPPTAA